MRNVPHRDLPDACSLSNSDKRFVAAGVEFEGAGYGLGDGCGIVGVGGEVQLFGIAKVQGLEDYGRDVRLAQDLERPAELPDISGAQSLADAPLQIGGGHPSPVRLVAEPPEVEGGRPAGGRGRVGGVMDGDDHLRPRGVREEGSVDPRDLLVPAPGQKDFPGWQDLGQLLRYGEVQVCLGEPRRALVPCVPAAVGSVYDYGTGEQVIREISSALVRELVGAEGLGGVCIQYLEDRSVHYPIVM